MQASCRCLEERGPVWRKEPYAPGRDGGAVGIWLLPTLPAALPNLSEPVSSVGSRDREAGQPWEVGRTGKNELSCVLMGHHSIWDD